MIQHALELATTQARQHHASRIHAIHLRVGALSGVLPEALQFAFAALAPGTLAEGGELKIESAPARFWCPVCQREFVIDTPDLDLPTCGTHPVELRGGRELELLSLEIE